MDLKLFPICSATVPPGWQAPHWSAQYERAERECDATTDKTFWILGLSMSWRSPARNEHWRCNRTRGHGVSCVEISLLGNLTTLKMARQRCLSTHPSLPVQPPFSRPLGARRPPTPSSCRGVPEVLRYHRRPPCDEHSACHGLPQPAMAHDSSSTPPSRRPRARCQAQPSAVGAAVGLSSVPGRTTDGSRSVQLGTWAR